MTAAIDVIKGGLEKLGAHSDSFNPAAPETLNRGLTELQAMIDGWHADGLLEQLVVRPTVTGSELSEPAGMREFLEFLMMFRMASVLQLDVPAQTVNEARRAIDRGNERWLFQWPKRAARTVRGNGQRYLT